MTLHTSRSTVLHDPLRVLVEGNAESLFVIADYVKRVGSGSHGRLGASVTSAGLAPYSRPPHGPEYP